MRSVILAFIDLLLALSIQGKKLKVFMQPDATGTEKLVFQPKTRVVRPRVFKVLTAYDMCKMECKRQTWNLGLPTYVEQLKAELAAAQAAVDQENAAAEQPDEPTAA